VAKGGGKKKGKLAHFSCERGGKIEKSRGKKEERGVGFNFAEGKKKGKVWLVASRGGGQPGQKEKENGEKNNHGHPGQGGEKKKGLLGQGTSEVKQMGMVIEYNSGGKKKKRGSRGTSEKRERV